VAGFQIPGKGDWYPAGSVAIQQFFNELIGGKAKGKGANVINDAKALMNLYKSLYPSMPIGQAYQRVMKALAPAYGMTNRELYALSPRTGLGLEIPWQETTNLPAVGSDLAQARQYAAAAQRKPGQPQQAKTTQTVDPITQIVTGHRPDPAIGRGAAGTRSSWSGYAQTGTPSHTVARRIVPTPYPDVQPPPKPTRVFEPENVFSRGVQVGNETVFSPEEYNDLKGRGEITDAHEAQLIQQQARHQWEQQHPWLASLMPWAYNPLQEQAALSDESLTVPGVQLSPQAKILAVWNAMHTAIRQGILPGIKMDKDGNIYGKSPRTKDLPIIGRVEDILPDLGYGAEGTLAALPHGVAINYVGQMVRPGSALIINGSPESRAGAEQGVNLLMMASGEAMAEPVAARIAAKFGLSAAGKKILTSILTSEFTNAQLVANQGATGNAPPGQIALAEVKSILPTAALGFTGAKVSPKVAALPTAARIPAKLGESIGTMEGYGAIGSSVYAKNPQEAYANLTAGQPQTLLTGLLFGAAGLAGKGGRPAERSAGATTDLTVTNPAPLAIPGLLGEGYGFYKSYRGVPGFSTSNAPNRFLSDAELELKPPTIKMPTGQTTDRLPSSQGNKTPSLSAPIPSDFRTTVLIDTKLKGGGLTAPDRSYWTKELSRINNTALLAMPTEPDNTPPVMKASSGAYTIDSSKTGNLLPGRAPKGYQTVGNAITPVGAVDELATKQQIGLCGRIAKTFPEMGALAMIYRNPRFETSRFIAVDNRGIIKFETGFTSKMPQGTHPHPHVPGAGFDPELAQQMIRLQASMKKAGATRCYLVHNHPNGDANPSMADSLSSAYFQKNLPGFAGQIIIDHNRISYTMGAGKDGSVHWVANIPIGDTNLPDVLLTPSLEHPLLGQRLTTVTEFVQHAKAVMTDPDQVIMLYTFNGIVRGIESMPSSDYCNTTNARKWITNRCRTFGSTDAFAIFSSQADGASRLTNATQSLMKTRTVTNGAALSDNSPTVLRPELKPDPLTSQEHKKWIGSWKSQPVTVGPGLDLNRLFVLTDFGKQTLQESGSNVKYEAWAQQIEQRYGPGAFVIRPYLPIVWRLLGKTHRSATAFPP